MSIYVVSKIRMAEVWRIYRAGGLPIISSWIDDGGADEIDFAEAWPRYLTEAAKAKFVIVYTVEGDKPLKGGILEIGAALAGGARVFIVGPVPEQLKTAIDHPRVYQMGSIEVAIFAITRNGWENL